MESIGTQFSQAREAKGATLSQAASATRIKIQHLEAMERDDFSNMAAAAYARGFIKIYAEYLEIPVEPLVRAYSEQHAPSPRRQGLSSDDLPEAPRPEETEQLAEKSGGSWSELVGDVGLVKRIAIPVVAIVLVVLLLSGLMKWLGGDADDEGEEGVRPPVSEADTLTVGDPPDAFLDLSIAETQP